MLPVPDPESIPNPFDLLTDAGVAVDALPADERAWLDRHFSYDGIPDDEAEAAADAWRNELDAMGRLDDVALMGVLCADGDPADTRVESELSAAAARHVLAERLAVAMRAA